MLGVRPRPKRRVAYTPPVFDSSGKLVSAPRHFQYEEPRSSPGHHGPRDPNLKKVLEEYRSEEFRRRSGISSSTSGIISGAPGKGKKGSGTLSPVRKDIKCSTALPGEGTTISGLEESTKPATPSCTPTPDLTNSEFQSPSEQHLPPMPSQQGVVYNYGTPR
eukprot:sb/3472777/